MMEPVCRQGRLLVFEISPDKALEMWLLSGRARVAALNTAEPNYVESLGAGTIQTP